MVEDEDEEWLRLFELVERIFSNEDLVESDEYARDAFRTDGLEDSGDTI